MSNSPFNMNFNRQSTKDWFKGINIWNQPRSDFKIEPMNEIRFEPQHNFKIEPQHNFKIEPPFQSSFSNLSPSPNFRIWKPLYEKDSMDEWKKPISEEISELKKRIELLEKQNRILRFKLNRRNKIRKSLKKL